jgi:hypothetical protein
MSIFIWLGAWNLISFSHEKHFTDDFAGDFADDRFVRPCDGTDENPSDGTDESGHRGHAETF